MAPKEKVRSVSELLKEKADKEKVAKEKERSAKKIQALKDHYAEMEQRARERREESAGASKYRKQIEKAGVEVVVDDRKERPGVKFKDADLIGFPIRITVGKLAPEGKVEYMLRREGEKKELSIEEAVSEAIDLVNSEKFGM